MKEIQKQVEKGLVTQRQSSQQLIECLIRLEVEQTRPDAKMELMVINSQLMPGGNPDFKSIRGYPAIVKLIEEHGRKTILKVIYLMVKDLCSSLNVVRNMNDEQMLESAGMLLDECDTFRLEDYQMMFTLGKRGHLVKIRDRVDINLITEMMDAYYQIRSQAAQRIQEEEWKQQEKDWQNNSPADAMTEQFGKLVGIMQAWQEEENIRKSDELAEERKKRAEDIERLSREYAAGHGVNYDEIARQFGKKKHDK